LKQQRRDWPSDIARKIHLVIAELFHLQRIDSYNIPWTIHGAPSSRLLERSCFPCRARRCHDHQQMLHASRRPVPMRLPKHPPSPSARSRPSKHPTRRLPGYERRHESTSSRKNRHWTKSSSPGGKLQMEHIASHCIHCSDFRVRTPPPFLIMMRVTDRRFAFSSP
jgi:hypothetical protein